MSIVGQGACYLDGCRDGAHDTPGPEGVRALLRRRTEGLVWLDLTADDTEALAVVAADLDIHPLAVDDTTRAHQRAKLQQFGDVTSLVLRPARWNPGSGSVEIGELHVFATPGVVVTVARGVTPDLMALRADLEADPTRLAGGHLAVLQAVVDAVIDDYHPVVARLETAVDEIEDDLFGGTTSVAERTYRLMRQVIEMGRATEPLPAMIDQARPVFDDSVEVTLRLDDMREHTVRIAERVDAFRTLLRHALEVNSILLTEQSNDESRRNTEASLAQGEQVKRISSWAAILFAPTLVASVYGMNFTYMPELDWRVGYPFALVLMVMVSVGLYGVFKRRGWL